MDERDPGLKGRYLPLFWRLFVPNAAVLCAASVVLIVRPPNGRVLVLITGLALMLVVNLMLMRRAFEPLDRLARMMRRIDPLHPGQRIEVPGPMSEVTVLTGAFNEMLDRLEDERRESGRRTLSAQEAERRHLAAELHDEIGQSLTALALQLDRLAGRLTERERAEVADVRDGALELVDDVRGIARRLRPPALDALGLPAALAGLAQRLEDSADLRIQRAIERDLPQIDPDEELVIFRVAQESLTNVVRHAGAGSVWMTLTQVDGHVCLAVADDGAGPGAGIEDGTGIRGMRERAVLIGAEFNITSGREGGTLVTLRVPLAAEVPE